MGSRRPFGLSFGGWGALGAVLMVPGGRVWSALGSTSSLAAVRKVRSGGRAGLPTRRSGATPGGPHTAHTPSLPVSHCCTRRFDGARHTGLGVSRRGGWFGQMVCAAPDEGIVRIGCALGRMRMTRQCQMGYNSPPRPSLSKVTHE